ncbi:DNA topoisomerase 6 subunit A-like [Rosa rugosa]|uniref:DNA topoisomerase 6 subunit A-like n=1 Tax=Rosa rugosa TaxID=74645 RepID=UPI002B4143F7|nr:DNA topoisomerase 6 subunit A-like [Rosa rugosa]
MGPGKDIFKTPARRPFTRSLVQRTPDAPQKPIFKDEEEQQIDECQLQMEHETLQKELSPAFWLYAESVKTETILQKLEKYRNKYRDTYFKNDDDPASENDDILQVVDMSAEDVKSDDPVEDHQNILQVVDMSPEDVKSKIGKLTALAPERGFPVPSRAESSQRFSDTLESWVLKRNREFKRKDTHDGEQYNITHALLTRIYKLCTKKKHMLLREIYYSNTKLYKDVERVAEAVNDVCCMIGCTRNSLYVSAGEKGLVYGDISFKLGELDFDGRSGGSRGITIPSNTSSISDIRSKDRLYFVIVVEKDTVFERLAEDGFCEKYHCIIITGKGMPGVDTRIFLHKISIELQLPVFALMDCNPYGLRIYSVYRYGSKKMSYDRDNLTTPYIQLLGIRYSDIDKFKIPAELLEELTEKDKETAMRLMGRRHLKDYHHDLKSMIEENKKIQIEALYYDDLEYLAEVALPMMLDEKLTQLLK